MITQHACPQLHPSKHCVNSVCYLQQRGIVDGAVQTDSGSLQHY